MKNLIIIFIILGFSSCSLFKKVVINYVDCEFLLKEGLRYSDSLDFKNITSPKFIIYADSTIYSFNKYIECMGKNIDTTRLKSINSAITATNELKRYSNMIIKNK